MISSKALRKLKGKGFTLIELMVVIAVLSIVMALIYSIFISQLRTATWRTQINEMQETCKASNDVFSADILQATDMRPSDAICDADVEFEVSGVSRARYFIDNATSQLKRDTWEYNSGTGVYDFASTTVVAENITDLDIECYNRDGGLINGVDLVGLSEDEKEDAADDVRRVDITTTCTTSRPRPGTDEYAERSFTTSVELRNIWLYSGKGCGLLSFKVTDSFDGNQTIAFCDPPGHDGLVEVKLCDLEGKAMEGDVEIFPKTGASVQVQQGGSNPTTIDIVNGTAVMRVTKTWATNATCSSITARTAIVNGSGSIPTGTGVEMLARWKPTGCDYYITTARSVVSESGDPFEFDDNALVISGSGLKTTSPALMNACSNTTSDLSVRLTDSCGNPLEGEDVNFKIQGTGGDITKGQIYNASGANVVAGQTIDADEAGSGVYTAIYNAANLPGIAISHLPGVTLEASHPTVSSITNTIGFDPHTPTLINASGWPGTLVVGDACPGAMGAVEYGMTDACGNVVMTADSDESGNLNATIDDPTIGSVETELANSPASDAQPYSLIFNTPDYCSDGGSPNATVTHSSGSNAVLPITTTQCPIPGLDITVENPVAPFTPPYQVASGCNRISNPVTGESPDPLNPYVTVGATLRKDVCAPWDIWANYTFEVLIANDTGTPVAEENGGFDNGSYTYSIANGDGIVPNINLFGKNDSQTVAPVVGTDLKVRAKAVISHETPGGPYGTDEFYDTYYYNVAQPLGQFIDVVKPEVGFRFFDGTFTDQIETAFFNCGTDTTINIQIDDCDAPAGIINATVFSVFPFSDPVWVRDAEVVQLSGSGGIFNTTAPLEVSFNDGWGFNSGKLITGSLDWIIVRYDDATDGAVEADYIPSTRSVFDFFMDDPLERSGEDAWDVFDDSHVFPNPAWHADVITDGAFARFGNNLVMAFNNEDGDFQTIDFSAVRGSLITPAFTLDTSPGSYLVFESSAHTEHTFQTQNFYDSRFVFITRDNGANWTLLDPVSLPLVSYTNLQINDFGFIGRNLAAGTFNYIHPHRLAFDLTQLPAEWDEQEVRVRFAFNSWDGAINQFRGWLIDNVGMVCNPDITPPAAPVLTGSTTRDPVTGDPIVSLSWPEIADAEGYSIFEYTGWSEIPLTPGDRPARLYENIDINDAAGTPSCTTAAGTVTCDFSRSAFLNFMNFFVVAFDGEGNISDFSNGYVEETHKILDVSMDCFEVVSSGLLGPPSDMILASGTVSDGDGQLVGDATVNLEADTVGLAFDSWSLITNSGDPFIFGSFCGTNEDDGSASPFKITVGDPIADTSMQATALGFINSPVETFANPGTCSCDSPCAPTVIAGPGVFGETITATCPSLWWGAGGYSKYYEFTLGALTTVNIDLEGLNPIFDPYLIIYDDSWNWVASNDNCFDRVLTGPWDSCVTIDLPAGTYRVEATSLFGGEFGDFKLSFY